MRSPRVLLLGKEFRELLASRAFWLLLIVIGPLVGHAFIVAIQLYAEMSGFGGAPAALPQALTPLDGVLVPTWSAYDLAATFLFPFVAIRLVSTEKESGSLKLLVQLPVSLFEKITIKALVLIFAWLIAWLPGLIAILMWRSYGGHTYFPETANLLIGHLLRGFLCIALGVVAAAITENAASAAILSLAVTVGTWVLDFIATGRGGVLQQIASFTPAAALRSFEQALFRVSTVMIVLAISVMSLVIAAIWLRLDLSIKAKALATVVASILLTVAVVLSGGIRTSWDLSENRRNSFSPADEAALHAINGKLKMTVFLAPEDPRLTDLEQNVLKKLRRALPQFEVEYPASSRTGLFESSGDHYGEITYELNGRTVTDRSTIEEVVLGNIYQLASVSEPDRSSTPEFSGYPLATTPDKATLIFYFIWPATVIICWWLIRRFVF